MQKLKIEYVDIDSIKPYKNNAKKHTPEQIEQIKKSIEQFGMDDPIGIWQNEIVEGHGTFSGADISHLTEEKLHSIRAVAREGTYSMTAKKNANYDGLNRALAKDLNKLNVKGAGKGQKARASGKSKNEVRKAYVDVLHDWYTKNASKYGFKYQFKANKDYDIKARRKLRK